MRRAVLIVLAWVAAAGGLGAQPEIVPAEHRVYDWLADQRVAGHLPEYRHETLPYDRLTVRQHLDSLAVREADLGPSGRYWLDEFRREFFEPLDRVHSYVGDGQAGVLDLEAERTWLYVRDDDWRVSVWGEGALEGRTAEGVLGPSGRPGPAGGASRSARLTFEASWRDRVGLYTSTVNGTQVSGDASVLLADPRLAPLYFVARDPTNVQGAFDQTTASVRVVGGPFSAEIANERLRFGASADAPMLLTDNADYLPFVRLGLKTRSVTVQAVHASLNSPSRTVASDDGDLFFESPDRFLAMHRLEVQPVGWFSAAFTEAVVYGRRGPEIAYLNPLFPVEAAEHTLWDRDNVLFTLEATVRPARGLEVYGTWLVDDLATATLGDASYGNKWGLQGGAQLALGATGVTAFGEYTRIEPYTYTHRFQEDGFFFNSYAHNDFGLGHPIGPNADQWLAGVQAWLPFRAHGRVSARYRRQGRNPVDAAGAVTNVGGDVNDGRAPEDGKKRFLDGDLFQGPGLQAALEVEPARGVALRLFADSQFWDGRPDDVFVRFGLAVRP